MIFDSRGAVVAREATLADRLRAIGLNPIDEEFVEKHKTAEIAKLPAMTPNYHVLRRLNAVLIMALLAALTGITFSLVNNAILPLLGSVVAFIGLLIVDAKTSRTIYDQPQWVTRTLQNSKPQMTAEVQILIDRIRLVSDGTVVAEHLIQNSTVLDPIWRIVEGSEHICFAITDQHKRIVRSAAQN